MLLLQISRPSRDDDDDEEEDDSVGGADKGMDLGASRPATRKKKPTSSEDLITLLKEFMEGDRSESDHIKNAVSDYN